MHAPEVLRIIRENPGLGEELPETAWRRLRELQILVPIEPGSEAFFMAEPVARLLSYLFNEANPATPEMVHGYVCSLETTIKRLGMALHEEVQQVKLAFEELGQALRRIHADLEETQHAILAEVAHHKTERTRVPVRVKYRRIVHWMERYVEPMIDIVRADGPLRAVFDEAERLLKVARAEALFNDHPALTRNLRLLRLVAAHALRVFTQCRKEIQPLYESLRRSSSIAEGAARALEKLQAEGLSKWGSEHLIPIAALRFQAVPGDAAISLSIHRVVNHPPEPAPVLQLSADKQDPGALIKLGWLNSLPRLVRNDLPLDDLLGWLLTRHPNPNTLDLLAGFGKLVFDAELDAAFGDGPTVVYRTHDGQIEATPVSLKLI